MSDKDLQDLEDRLLNGSDKLFGKRASIFDDMKNDEAIKIPDSFDIESVDWSKCAPKPDPRIYVNKETWALIEDLPVKPSLINRIGTFFKKLFRYE